MSYLVDSDTGEPERLHINGEIPALLWRAQGQGPRPVIIWPGVKREVDPEARDSALAAGVSLLAFDMHLHGERLPPDFRLPARATLSQFLDLVEQTARDLDGVLRHAKVDSKLDADRTGIRAISLGASATLAAIGGGLGVRACLSICGSGDFAAASSWRMRRDGSAPDRIAAEIGGSAERLARLDPLHHPEAFPPCAVMMMHGTADGSVPIEAHRALFDALAPYYLDRPQDLVFLSHPDGHGIRPGLHHMGWNWLLERLTT